MASSKLPPHLDKGDSKTSLWRASSARSTPLTLPFSGKQAEQASLHLKKRQYEDASREHWHLHKTLGFASFSWQKLSLQYRPASSKIGDDFTDNLLLYTDGSIDPSRTSVLLHLRSCRAMAVGEANGALNYYRSHLQQYGRRRGERQGAGGRGRGAAGWGRPPAAAVGPVGTWDPLGP